MSCPSCKGTGRIQGIFGFSQGWECVDCEVIPGKTFTVDLPAAPMAKCTEDGPITIIFDYGASKMLASSVHPSNVPLFVPRLQAGATYKCVDLPGNRWQYVMKDTV